MYQIGLIRSFSARHYLVGGDWGQENRLHGHDYTVEWALSGPELDANGFLLDLVAVAALLEEALADIRGGTLNDLAAFHGVNPSVERLCRFLSERLVAGRPRWDTGFRLTGSQIKVFESSDAWASWSEALPGASEAS